VGRGGLGESGQMLGRQRKQDTRGWDGEQKATKADGEGVKIDQRAGRSVITTWHSSQTRIKCYLCSFAFLGCQEVNGNPPAAQVVGGCSGPRDLLSWMSCAGAQLHERSLV